MRNRALIDSDGRPIGIHQGRRTTGVELGDSSQGSAIIANGRTTTIRIGVTKQ